MYRKIGVPNPTRAVGGLPAIGAQSLDVATLTSTATKTKMLEAVKVGHGTWRLQARFKNIMINGLTAIGTPGCLDGPALESLIKAAPGVAGEQGASADLRNAVAKGVSKCFAQWQSMVTVPGLPWYPMFVAFPGPMAPPTPNVPTPLIACPSGLASKIMTAPPLKQEIVAALPAALRVPQVEACVGTMAQSLALYFTSWLPMQMVTNVLGKGPVPSFAPPYVPVGTVVGGSIISSPGHLASGGQPSMIVM
jgi:hypothetical protein